MLEYCIGSPTEIEDRQRTRGLVASSTEYASTEYYCCICLSEPSRASSFVTPIKPPSGSEKRSLNSSVTLVLNFLPPQCASDNKYAPKMEEIACIACNVRVARKVCGQKCICALEHFHWRADPHF